MSYGMGARCYHIGMGTRWPLVHNTQRVGWKKTLIMEHEVITCSSSWWHTCSWGVERGWLSPPLSWALICDTAPRSCETTVQWPQTLLTVSCFSCRQSWSGWERGHPARLDSHCSFVRGRTTAFSSTWWICAPSLRSGCWATQNFFLSLGSGRQGKQMQISCIYFLSPIYSASIVSVLISYYSCWFYFDWTCTVCAIK